RVIPTLYLETSRAMAQYGKCLLFYVDEHSDQIERLSLKKMVGGEKMLVVLGCIGEDDFAIKTTNLRISDVQSKFLHQGASQFRRQCSCNLSRLPPSRSLRWHDEFELLLERFHEQLRRTKLRVIQTHR
ncbi:hypothetical protein PMAYCL1PPCAC_00528, partial [Pristionchus mayeri]